MAITLTITQEDLLGLSPQFSQSIAKIKDWAAEVNATAGASNELRVVADTAALKAVAAADRADGDVAVLADSGQIMRFSAASSAPEALGPPITVIAPTAGSGRWLAVALPPQSSVDATALASNAVTAVKLGNATQSVGGAAFSLFSLTSSGVVIGNTAGSTDLSASGSSVALFDAWYIPSSTVGALSTIQIQTAGGAANITEALDISATTAGTIKRFASIDQNNNTLAANEGFRVETIGTDLEGVLVCVWAKVG